MNGSLTIQRRIASALGRMFDGDAGAGLLLILAAALAMLAANSPLAGAYHDLFHYRLAWTPVAKLDTWHLWINDALMAVFFFVVGLEIKREVLDGELSTWPKRRLPVLAAAAGMALPAACYLAIAGREPGLAAGWAIPAATDIAFAVGVLGLAGKGLPPSLRLFLLTVAIVDDLGAVAVIALFYTAQLDLVWLGAAALCLGVLIGLNLLRLQWGLAYLIAGVLLWYCVLHSGIHATVAGVAAAMTVPLRLDGRRDSMLLRLEHALIPWSAYLIVPLFGFANAGVGFSANGIAGALEPLPLAVAVGLILGKQAGVFGAVFAADRLGFAPRPAGASWTQIWGLALLCGIGFTMSLFIGGLAFPHAPALAEEAKLGVLTGSLIAAALGFLVLRLGTRQRR